MLSGPGGPDHCLCPSATLTGYADKDGKQGEWDPALADKACIGLGARDIKPHTYFPPRRMY